MPGPRAPAGVLACAASAAGGCISRRPAPTEVPPVCHRCFWEHQDPGLRDEVEAVYAARTFSDPLVRAEIDHLLARIRGDRPAVCAAATAFEGLAGAEPDRRRRLHAAESAAFLARECDRPRREAFERAAAAAEAAGDAWKARLYRDVAAGRFVPRSGKAQVRTRPVEVPAGAREVVLGESAIRIDAASVVAVQVDRTVRDWLSYGMGWDFAAGDPGTETLLDYHEGARLRDIRGCASVRILPVTGVPVAWFDGRWLAPDADGVFRYEVLEDKIRYPTTRADGGLAWVVDTHGISSLVRGAVATGADAVVGCGDHPEKVAAALDLAERGIDVYFPCDRFVGDLVGYDAPGTIVGSAPVRAEGGVAIVGGTPVAFRLEETIVVEDTAERGILQYYDAPARYFRRLAESVPLAIESVAVEGAGQAGRVTGRALEVGADAIAVRVWNEDDYVAVRDWLAGSPERRAVLFHSAPYPSGYRLFGEFPGRTTFGDPRPRVR